MRVHYTRMGLATAAVLAIAACGGGGGTNVASTPPPPSGPPTPTPAAVNIFPNPQPETYASVGVGLNRSTADADQPHIRYTSAGFYEIQMPGAAYDRLVPLKGFIPQDPETNGQFQPASTAQNEAYFFTSNSRLAGYRYSEMAIWASQIGGGYVAFGSATPSEGVPVTGSANYTGLVQGVTDITEPYDESTIVAVGVTGAVALSFDFGAGTLGGSMSLKTDSLTDTSVDLGPFAFKNTVYSTGSATYSGAFDTMGTGSNFFLGRFTGPNAEETIGAWGLPFALGGENHQGFGSWIAKKR